MQLNIKALYRHYIDMGKKIDHITFVPTAYLKSKVTISFQTRLLSDPVTKTTSTTERQIE